MSDQEGIPGVIVNFLFSLLVIGAVIGIGIAAILGGLVWLIVWLTKHTSIGWH